MATGIRRQGWASNFLVPARRPLQVDHGAPFGSGLVSLVIPGDMPGATVPRELAGPGSATVFSAVGGIMPYTTGTPGVGLSFDGTRVLRRTTNIGWDPTATGTFPLTQAVLARTIANPGAATYAAISGICRNNAGTQATPYAFILLNGEVGQQEITLDMNTSGVETYLSGIPWAANNEPFLFIATSRAVNDHTLVLRNLSTNTVTVLTHAVNVGLAASAPDEGGIGGISPGGVVGSSNYNGDIYARWVWNRGMTADEAVGFVNNPFAMLKPRRTTRVAALTGTDATVNLTGVAGTSAVGTVTPSIAKTPTGVSGAGAVGTVTPAIAKTPTGVVGAGAIGTVVPAIAKGITGVSGTTAVGSVFTQPVLIWDTHDWTEAVWSIPPTDRSQTVSGNVGTGQVGSVAPTILKGVTGVSGAGAVGTVVPGVGAQPTGAAGTGAAGTPSVTVAKTLTGVAGTGAVGTAAPTVIPTVSGVSATGQVGTVSLSISTSVTLTGVGAAGQVGSLTPEVAKALTGVQATGAVGTLTVRLDSTATLTGVSATGAVGAVVPTVAPTVTGVQAAGQVGTTVPTVAKVPTGVSAAGAVGTLAPVVAVTLAGVQAAGQVGNVSVTAGGSATVNLAGVSAIGAAGDLGPVVTVALAGVSASGQAGTPTVTTAAAPAPEGPSGGGGLPLPPTRSERAREALRQQARSIRDMLERVYDGRPLTDEEAATVEAAEDVEQEATEAADAAPADLPAPDYGPLIARLEALLVALAALILRLEQDAEEDDILALLLAT